MENIKELTLNSQEPAPHEAPDFALLKARVTSEDIENLRTSLTPRRQKHFNSIDPDVQAEYAVLFKFPEEELKRLIPFLSSGGDYTFSMNTISDALDFLDQGILGGNGKYQSLKKFVKKWREGNIHGPVLKQEEEYREEEIRPQDLNDELANFIINITPEDILRFKEGLSPKGLASFEKYSSEKQRELTAVHMLPEYRLRQMVRCAIKTGTSRFLGIHDINNALQFFELPEVAQVMGDKYKKIIRLEEQLKRDKENKKIQEKVRAEELVS